ncbi:MAG: hypothetical protein DRJ60_00105 [Thermoprotei archaeon]|nr:MAG: hypothetical protein DRJ60_00105 [Thermoprotei archaeon]
MVVLIAKSLDEIKDYIDYAKCVIYRVYPDEIRIRVGRYGIRYKPKDDKDRDRILRWLEELKQVKVVIQVVNTIADEAFFS